MKQNSKLHINLTTELKEKLKRKAEKSGFTLNGYVLFLLTNAEPKVEIINQ